ncbi:MAG: DNA-processing protein DprA [Homoserinimonas sp.]
MTMFGIKEAVVSPLIRALADDDLQPAEIAERFARSAWTGIAEPGDRIAGLLVAALGPARALAAVVDRWPTVRIMAAVAEAGTDSLTEVEATDALKRWQPRITSASALIALKQASRFNVRLLIPGDPEWPMGMADLGLHAPIALWLRGNVSTMLSLEQSISLVGARAATGYGEHVTMEASASLVDRGYSIVSGAAYGIDGMAHRAALASSGQTVAFLAGGVDRFYPSGHDALLTRIVESGAVVSELPCGSQPTKWRFLQRNRLIAAASQATIVMEAGWRSGSLNTAGHAAALGRPLGAVPGPVTSMASAGCHRLIRDFDAVCVTNAGEMAELAPLPGAGSDVDQLDGLGEGATSEQVRVFDALSTRSPRTAHDIAARAGLSVASVQAILGAVSIEGSVAERERGWVKKLR